MATNPRSLMTINDVALVLRVSRSTVRRLLDRGELRCIRIGGSLRVAPSDVDEMLAATVPVCGANDRDPSVSSGRRTPGEGSAHVREYRDR